MQELDQGGGAPPDVRATNMTASSQSVVDDLADEHYLETCAISIAAADRRAASERAGFCGARYTR